MELGGYLIGERIAVGGMAEIYRAEAQEGERAGTLVVLKRLLPNHRGEKAYVESFVEEGKLCVKLRHPNIVRTYKVFKNGPDIFMEQELVDGTTLRALLDRAVAEGAPLPLPAVLHALAELCKALDYFHRARLGDAQASLVHRDVNPANLLIGRDGAVKLTDFGVAEGEGMGAKKVAGTLRGTLGYMAPEQVVGRDVDRRSDLFAVGVILWEAVANQPAFEGESDFAVMEAVRDARIPALRSVVPDAPELLEKVLRKGLAKDPAHRFQTATEWLKAIGMLKAIGAEPDPAALAALVDR